MQNFSFTMRLVFALALSLAVWTGSFAEPAPRPSPIPIHGMPKILAITMPATRDFYAGQTIRGSVETSPNVGYVEARIQYRNQALRHDGVGKFSLAYTIPWWLPPWLRSCGPLELTSES